MAFKETNGGFALVRLAVFLDSWAAVRCSRNTTVIDEVTGDTWIAEAQRLPQEQDIPKDLALFSFHGAFRPSSYLTFWQADKRYDRPQ